MDVVAVVGFELLVGRLVGRDDVGGGRGGVVGLGGLTSLPPSSEQRPGNVDEQEVDEGQEEQARPGEYIFPPDRLPASP